MKRTSWVYSIIHPMVHHIERYSNEELFDENDMTFENAIGK